MDGGSGFRKRERLELHIPMRVRCRETDGTEWHELTQVQDVTQFGASFYLQHAIDVGRIIFMSLPLPWRLRQFDQSADLYNVYALVRWVKPVEGKYSVGVAFVGKTPPTSYMHDPSRRYGTEGFTEKRKETRIPATVPISIQMLDAAGAVMQAEATVTTNISRKGATCYTTLAADVGTFLHVASEDGAVAIGAVVRSRGTDQHGIPILRLEFLGAEWPLDVTSES